MEFAPSNKQRLFSQSSQRDLVVSP